MGCMNTYEFMLPLQRYVVVVLHVYLIEFRMKVDEYALGRWPEVEMLWAMLGYEVCKMSLPIDTEEDSRGIKWILPNTGA